MSWWYGRGLKTFETHWTQHSKTRMFVLGPGSGIPWTSRVWTHLIPSNQSRNGNFFQDRVVVLGGMKQDFVKSLRKKVFLAIWKSGLTFYRTYSEEQKIGSCRFCRQNKWYMHVSDQRIDIRWPQKDSKDIAHGPIANFLEEIAKSFLGTSSQRNVL